MKLRLPLLALASLPACVQAAEVGVVGLAHDKAILIVDGAPPKAYAVGSAIGSDARLVAVDSDSATIESGNKRFIIPLGQAEHRSTKTDTTSIVLAAGERGHFMAPAQINGVRLQMMVDTGASLVTLNVGDAIRMGVDYKAGRRGRFNTANGTVNAYVVKLDTVRIGDIELHQVDAAVLESGPGTPLLGMSFLNRMEMKREGDQMTLTRRY